MWLPKCSACYEIKICIQSLHSSEGGAGRRHLIRSQRLDVTLTVTHLDREEDVVKIPWWLSDDIVLAAADQGCFWKWLKCRLVVLVPGPPILPQVIWQCLLPLKPNILSRPHPPYSPQPVKGNLTLFFKCKDPVGGWGSAHTPPLWPRLSILTLTATVKPLAPHPCPHHPWECWRPLVSVLSKRTVPRGLHKGVHCCTFLWNSEKHKSPRRPTEAL